MTPEEFNDRLDRLFDILESDAGVLSLACVLSDVKKELDQVRERRADAVRIIEEKRERIRDLEEQVSLLQGGDGIEDAARSLATLKERIDDAQLVLNWTTRLDVKTLGTTLSAVSAILSGHITPKDLRTVDVDIGGLRSEKEKKTSEYAAVCKRMGEIRRLVQDGDWSYGDMQRRLTELLDKELPKMWTNDVQTARENGQLREMVVDAIRMGYNAALNHEKADCALRNENEVKGFAEETADEIVHPRQGGV